MSRIAIMESLGISKEELEQRKEPFVKAGHVFTEFERTDDVEKLKEEARDADVMILANMPMPDSVISSCGNLKFIDVAFTGVDHVGLKAAKELGIKVSNASGYSNEAVAELVIGMVLSIGRHMRAVEDRARTGGTKAGLIGTELKGKKAGIIGLGKIGTRTAELFHAFGCEVLAYNRTFHKDAASYVRQTDMKTLLEESDIVVLHCPLNDSTRGMIGMKELQMMKKSAMLINVARGGVVVSSDLAEALNQGIIAAAGIDVFDQEPPLAANDPLVTCRNCLITPHVAFATEESMTLRAEIVFDNLAAWLDGKQKNVIL